MPTYVYVVRDENDEIIAATEDLRSVDERKESMFIEDVEYKYAPGYLNAPTNFILSGPGWTSNSKIRYEDPHEFKVRKEEEVIRKDMVQKRKELSGFENDASYGNRIKQGIDNMLTGKKADGTIDPDSPNVSKIAVGQHEQIEK